MSTISIDDGKLRGLLKEALIEVLEEKPELLRDMLAEAIEEIGLNPGDQGRRGHSSGQQGHHLEGAGVTGLNVQFRSSFLKDVKVLTDKPLKDRIKDAIAQVENARRHDVEITVA